MRPFRSLTASSARLLLPLSALPCWVSRRQCAAAPAGRWTCSCGFNNFAFHRQCFRCTKDREGPSAYRKASPLTLLDNEPAVESIGYHWGKPRKGDIVAAEGVWMCGSCNTFNGATRTACTHCQTARPGADRPKSGSSSSSASANDNELDRRNEHLRNSAAGVHPDAPMPVQRSARQHVQPEQPFKPGDWYCSCGAHNFARKKRCGECGASAPVGHGDGRESRRHSARSGDWVCPGCQMYNFSRRAVCMRCQCPQPAASRAAATADEAADNSQEHLVQGWVCQACHSLNPSPDLSCCAVCGSRKTAAS